MAGDDRSRDPRWEEPPKRGHRAWAYRYRCPDCPTFTFQKQGELETHRRMFHKAAQPRKGDTTRDPP